MLIIDEATAQQVVGMADAIDVVERAFIALERGEAEAFPVVMGHGSLAETGFAVKSGVIRGQGLVGLKVGTYWPANRQAGLPSHGSTTLFLDDATGFPRALVSAAYLTAMRTAAADAVAVKRLARPDARHLGIVGAGHQAWFDLLAIREVRPIDRLLVWNRDPAGAERFAERARRLGMAARAASLEETARGADILVTATAARQPLVMRDWIAPGTHISAMGADAAGKQELDIALVAAGELFADIPSQSVTLGEFEAAAGAGLIQSGDVRTLGSAIVGDTPARSSPAAITIFDSSGTGLLDLAIGALAIDRCTATGRGRQTAFS